jgi:predicted secreted protein
MPTLPAIVKAVGDKVIYHNKGYYVTAGANGYDIWKISASGQGSTNIHSIGRKGEEGLRKAKAYIVTRIQESYKYF